MTPNKALRAENGETEWRKVKFIRFTQGKQEDENVI